MSIVGDDEGPGCAGDEEGNGDGDVLEKMEM
jgi:hypothetical protein